MPYIGKEAKNFIVACEAIHTLLGRGPLAPKDRDLIVFSALELLRKVKRA